MNIVILVLQFIMSLLIILVTGLMFVVAARTWAAKSAPMTILSHLGLWIAIGLTWMVIGSWVVWYNREIHIASYTHVIAVMLLGPIAVLASRATFCALADIRLIPVRWKNRGSR